MGATVICGDSFTGTTPANKVWATMVQEATGAHIINRAIWGAGYVDPGPGPGGTGQRFLRQAIFQANPALVTGVVLAGSVNDQTVDPDLYRSIALQTHLHVQNVYPNAKLMTVGPFWAGPNPVPAEVLRLRDILLETMWTYDWKYPLIDPIKENWFPPNRLDLLAADQFHPNLAGQTVIYNKMLPHMRNFFGI
jgi:hypothetical protein